MSDPIDLAIVEKAAKAMADNWPDCDPILAAMFRDYAQTALEAVADDLRAEGAAEALREAADAMDADPEIRDPLHIRSAWLRNRADQIVGADQ